MLTFAEAVAQRIERIYGHLEVDDPELRHASDGRRNGEAAQTEHRTVDTQPFADVLDGERWPYQDYRLDGRGRSRGGSSATAVSSTGDCLRPDYRVGRAGVVR